jgi:hypothetical protein
VSAADGVAAGTDRGAGAVHVPAESQQVLRAAEEELVVECMRDRGMAYVPEPVAGHGREDSAASLYGLLSPRNAWLHGYGMGEELASPSAVPAERTTPHARR